MHAWDSQAYLGTGTTKWAATGTALHATAGPVPLWQTRVREIATAACTIPLAAVCGPVTASGVSGQCYLRAELAFDAVMTANV